MKLVSQILAIILFSIVLYWDINTDYRKWLKGVVLVYWKESLNRVLLLIPVFVLLLWPILYKDIWVWSNLIGVGVVTGLIFSVWWELFDGLYNLKRGFKWRFNGSIDPNDPTLDKFLRRIGDKQEAALKLGLILIFLVAYILVQ